MRVGEQLLDEPLSCPVEVLWRDDAVDQADALGLGRVDQAGRHDQLLRAAEPDDGRQARRAPDVGDDSEPHLREPELRVARGDPQIAAECDLERAPDARAVDLADDRLGHRFAEVRALEKDIAKRSQQPGLAGGLGQLAEVHAGGEDGSLAAQDDAVHAALGGRVSQLTAEAEQQLLIHRVALLRAVQHDVPDRSVIFAEDDAHRGLLTVGVGAARAGRHLAVPAEPTTAHVHASRCRGLRPALLRRAPPPRGCAQ